MLPDILPISAHFTGTGFRFTLRCIPDTVYKPVLKPRERERVEDAYDALGIFWDAHGTFNTNRFPTFGFELGSSSLELSQDRTYGHSFIMRAHKLV